MKVVRKAYGTHSSSKYDAVILHLLQYILNKLNHKKLGITKDLCIENITSVIVFYMPTIQVLQ